MAYFTYNLLLAILSPLLLPYALVRSWFRGIRGGMVWERLGRLPSSFEQTHARSIWLHAVSVGEAVAVEPLLARLRARLPGVPIYLSTTTPEGRQVAEEQLSSLLDGIFYQPLDFPFAVRRILETIQPKLVIVSETEIWPNLYRLVKRQGAKLMVVNGRMSDRSAPRYKRLRWFFSTVLGEVDRVLVQSEQDKPRFLAAGAPEECVVIGGNLKYDFAVKEGALPADLASFIDRLAPDSVLVAGSTREAEEGPIVAAFRKFAIGRPRALLVVAPRHPSRFDEAADAVEASGLPLVRRSELDGEGQRDVEMPAVLLLDSVGELASFYSRADLVFVGGSLNGWGGHNVLEPAIHGRPVIVGPYMQNFRDIADGLLRERAIVQIKAPRELAGAFERILSDPETARELGGRAREVAERQRGAADRAVEEAYQLYHSAQVPAARQGGLRAAVLRMPAALWKAGADAHASAYERGYLKRGKLDTFTVCVGNITVGGTGKTPTVMWLVEKLHAEGVHAAVLTRGYRRDDGARETVIEPGEALSPLVGGDEAQLLHREFQRREIAVSLGIAADRYRVGRRIEDAAQPDLFVLDDGFQHFRLDRDFDLVLIDAGDPFGGGELVPLGRLREPLSGLARASAFLLTRTQAGGDYRSIEERLRQLNPSAPIYRSSVETTVLRDVVGGKDLPFESLARRRVLAFAGLGNPDGFFRVLEQRQATVTGCLRFRDHHRYTKEDVETVLESAWSHKAQLVVTTEKDFVNLCHAVERTHFEEDGLEAAVAELFGAVPLAWLGIQMKVENGDELMRRIVEGVRLSGSATALT